MVVEQCGRPASSRMKMAMSPPNTTWTVYEMPSTTLDHPHGDFNTAVLGKWKYDAALGAFIALDEVVSAGGDAWDASVWLYKPMAVVPEPEK